MVKRHTCLLLEHLAETIAASQIEKGLGLPLAPPPIGSTIAADSVDPGAELTKDAPPPESEKVSQDVPSEERPDEQQQQELAEVEEDQRNAHVQSERIRLREVFAKAGSFDVGDAAGLEEIAKFGHEYLHSQLLTLVGEYEKRIGEEDKLFEEAVLEQRVLESELRECEAKIRSYGHVVGRRQPVDDV